MEPSTLAFSDTNLERLYENKRWRDFLIPMESWFLQFDIIFTVAIIVIRIARKHCLVNYEGLLHLLSIIVIAAHIIFIHFTRDTLEMPFWQISVALYKVLRGFILTMMVSRCFTPSDDKPFEFYIWFLSSMILQVLFGMGLPLMFKEHVALQFPLGMASALIRTPSICHAVLAQPKLRSGFLKFILDTFAILSGKTHFPFIEHSEDTLPVMCFHFFTLLYFLVPFIFSTSILWVMEWKSRHAFFRDLQQNGQFNNVRLDDSWFPDSPIMFSKASHIPSLQTLSLGFGVVVVSIYWAFLMCL